MTCQCNRCGHPARYEPTWLGREVDALKAVTNPKGLMGVTFWTTSVLVWGFIGCLAVVHG